MKSIQFNKHLFYLEESGALIWPKKSVAIVSDLHLEKSSYFAKDGIFLPPYDSYETLLNLKKMIKTNGVKKLILLGDIFHDNYGFERLERNSKKIFKSILDSNEIVFVHGNHDENINIPDVKFFYNFTENNINFSHEPKENNNHQVCGHLHPKITLKVNNKKISKKCFVLTKKIIFLPAYGKFTGGLDIKHNVFKKYIDKNSIFFPIHNNKIYKVNDFLTFENKKL